MAKKRYSVAEARAKLPRILDEVGAGAEVTLTRRGLPAAVVVSPKAFDALREERPTFAGAYGAFLRRRSPRDLELDPTFFDALRDRAPGRKVRL